MKENAFFSRLKAKSLVPVLSAGVFLLLLSPVFFFTLRTEAAADSTVKKYEDTLSQLEKEQAALKAALSQTQAQQGTVAERKKLIDEEITLLNEQIDLANELLKEYDDQISEFEADIARREAEIAEKNAEFEEQLVYYYKNRNLNYLAVLFHSASFSDFILRLQRVSVMMNTTRDQMNAMNAAKSDLSVIKQSLTSSKDRQNEIRLSLESKEAEAESRSKEAMDLILSLGSQQSAYQSQINTLAAEKAAQEAKLQAYLEELARLANPYVGGSMAWPTLLKNNRISSYYGNRDLWGSSDFHLGIDIVGPNLDPVYAANDGTVVSPPTHWSYGKCILIDHGGGISTLYAHCATLLVNVGDKVTRGQQIAKIGLTGNTSGYHLHFEVRVNGKTTNPLNGYVVQP